MPYRVNTAPDLTSTVTNKHTVEARFYSSKTYCKNDCNFQRKKIAKI